MLKLAFASLITLLGGISAAFAAGDSSPAEPSNKVSIKQTGSGNSIVVRQSSSPNSPNSTYVEQEVSDQYGNRSVVMQQGKNNVAEFTQQGRFENVVNSGNVYSNPANLAQPAPTAGNVTVESFGDGKANN